MRWRHFRFGDVEIDVPEALVSAGTRGIEGRVAVLEGRGLRLTLDVSLFADPLTGYQAKAGYECRQEDIGGSRHDVVLFNDDAGGKVVAARFQGSLTAVVHVVSDADTDVALKIIRSIVLRQGETDD